MINESIEQARQFANFGNIERAKAICNNILISDSNDSDALHLLGVLHTASDEPAAAIPLIQKSIEIDGGSAKQYTNLGNALYASGGLNEAEVAYQKAISIDPEYDDAYFNFGVMQEAQENYMQASVIYQHVIEINPDHADAYNNLGAVLRELGIIEESLIACQRAVDINPGSSESLYNLGLSQQANNDHESALKSFSEALGLDDHLLQVYREMVNSLIRLERYPDALKLMADATLLDSAMIDQIATLAIEFESNNRLEDARLMVEKGLELDPAHPVFHLVNAKLARRDGHPDQGVEELEGVDLSGVKSDISMHIMYELGRLHDRLGNTEIAYDAFVKANLIQYDEYLSQNTRTETFLDRVNAWRSSITNDWLSSCIPSTDITDSSHQVVFIVGFPRSGTTLLDQILDSHPKLRTIEEKPLLQGLMNEVIMSRGMPKEFPQAVARMDTGLIKKLRKLYLDNAARYVDLKPGEILVDKLPLNIVNIPLIWRVFPDAKIILALRHPNDVCLSCFMQHFGMNDAMSYFSNLEDAAQLYSKVMGLWLHYTQMLPISYHAVHYEDMVSNTREEISQLLSYLGVEWNDGVMQFYEHARSRKKINTPSYHQVTEPIYNRAAYRWLRYMDKLEPVMNQLQPYIKQFGYS